MEISKWSTSADTEEEVDVVLVEADVEVFVVEVDAGETFEAEIGAVPFAVPVFDVAFPVFVVVPVVAFPVVVVVPVAAVAGSPESCWSIWLSTAGSTAAKTGEIVQKSRETAKNTCTPARIRENVIRLRGDIIRGGR